MHEIPGREWQVPDAESLDIVFSFPYGEVTYICTPYNTYFRTFDTGEGRYDHFVMDLDSQVAFPLNNPQVEEVKERLITHGFAHYHDAEPDEATLNIYEDLKSKGWHPQQQ